MLIPLSTEQKQSLLWLSVALALVVLLALLGPVLMPFVVSGILAYVLNPWVDKLSAWRIKKWSLPRPMAASITILLLIAAVLAMVLVIVPILQKEIPQLQAQIPRFFDKFDQTLSPLLAAHGFNIRLDSAGIKDLLTEQLAGSGDVIGKAVLSSIKVGGTAVLGMLANLLLIPIVLFYLLLDWHALLERLSHFIPRRWVSATTSGLLEVDDLLAQYLRGQILVMLVLAAYYSIALSIARFDLAIPVGIITGFLVFIPYIGYGLGLALAADRRGLAI